MLVVHLLTSENTVESLFEKKSITLLSITLIFTYNLRQSNDFSFFLTF